MILHLSLTVCFLGIFKQYASLKDLYLPRFKKTTSILQYYQAKHSFFVKCYLWTMTTQDIFPDSIILWNVQDSLCHTLTFVDTTLSKSKKASQYLMILYFKLQIVYTIWSLIRRLQQHCSHIFSVRGSFTCVGYLLKNKTLI